MQAVEPTVQGALEAALTRLTGERRVVDAAGRTDRGVHATGQVIGITLPERWDAPTLKRALNGNLPRDIWVESVEPVDPAFHPRFDAVARHYAYRVGESELSSSPFLRPSCWSLRRPLDRDLLERAAAFLPGDHSFRAFSKAGQEERGDRCTVHLARWEVWDGVGVQFRVSANRFLHHMVRYLVGTMVKVALGERPLEDVPALLAGDPGLRTSPPAPAQGLFLVGVDYPDLRLIDRPIAADTRSTGAPSPVLSGAPPSLIPAAPHRGHPSEDV